MLESFVKKEIEENKCKIQKERKRKVEEINNKGAQSNLPYLDY